MEVFNREPRRTRENGERPVKAPGLQGERHPPCRPGPLTRRRRRPNEEHPRAEAVENQPGKAENIPPNPLGATPDTRRRKPLSKKVFGT